MDKKANEANDEHQKKGLPLDMFTNGYSNLPDNIQMIKTLGSLSRDLPFTGDMGQNPADESDIFRRTYEDEVKDASKRAPRIFVSHSHVDDNFCAGLARKLRDILGDESSVWCDLQEGLHGGDMWWSKLVSELDTRNVFLLVLSPEAVNSLWVRYELNIALDRDMLIIPIILSDCIIPVDTRDISVIYFYSSTIYDVAFKELLRAIGISLGGETHGRKRNFENPRMSLVQEMTSLIWEAFANNQWYNVLRKTHYLDVQAPGFITPVIYRMQALSLSNVGYQLLALEVLDTALALVSDKTFYLKLLDDYIIILISLGRWVDCVRYVDEALQVAPEDAYWLARQRQVYAQQEQPVEDTLVLSTHEDEYKPDLSLINGESMQKKRVFISYSHNDKKYLDRLHAHLKQYKTHDPSLDVWDDTRIEAGAKWLEEIRKALGDTKVAVFLISADFFASEFIVEKELSPLLKAADQRGVKILSVILSASAFNKSSLAQYQAINSPDKPLGNMSKGRQEEVWDRLAKQIYDFVHNA